MCDLYHPVLLFFIVAGESHVSDMAMIVCMIISRCWLWMCDLAQTQIMQTWVAEETRGGINAMQKATSQIFYCLMLMISLYFSN